MMLTRAVGPISMTVCSHGPRRSCPTARERSDRRAQNLMC